MRTFWLLLLAFLTTASWAIAQTTLEYYLPQEDVRYDPEITKPAAVLGHEVGEWHVTHDKLVFYLNRLAQESERMTIDTIGYTYERRPLLHVVLSSPQNHSRLEEIRQAHVALSDPNSEASVTEEMPVVVWEGFSIHGNESSGSNAALLTAYYLAAAQGEAVENLLQNAVIILDPCFNPDGLNRFAAWVNANKSQTQTSDPNHREFDEPWPGGRTNHYWFDLNRDWLPVQHPESQARIARFQHWKPNILTDHHEMGTNSTFFFQPGIPERTNPLTPPKNQELTGKIGTYHARALDNIGSLYYTEESFDDFYYGKGSTYPDANGCIGILFEQASSRGHAQESQHGVLTFPFTIRNQFTTSLSTIEAGVGLREELLRYQRAFYQQSQEEARDDSEKAFVVGHPHDSVRLYHFHQLLRRHGVQTHRLRDEITKNGATFRPENSLLIPAEQARYRLIKALFQQETQFTDSLFYDVSAWTMPMAFGLPFATLSARELSATRGDAITTLTPPQGQLVSADNPVAYVMDWRSYEAPAALYDLQGAGTIVKVAEKPFRHGETRFPAGSLLIPATQPERSSAEVAEHLERLTQQYAVVVRELPTGLTTEGIDLGSPSFSRLYTPQVLLLTGSGVSSYEAGEVWHLLDQRVGVPVTLGDVQDLGGIELEQYTSIVMVNGNYSLSEAANNRLKNWVFQGGTLLLTKNAVRWAKTNNYLRSISLKERASETFDSLGYRPYVMRRRDQGAQYIGGAILEAELDLTHPLCFGYSRKRIPVFRNSRLVLHSPKNPYQVPVRYTEKPLLSGYVSEENQARLRSTPASYIETSGRGKVIALTDNPNFRAFWYGTNRLFLNGIFMGGIID